MNITSYNSVFNEFVENMSDLYNEAAMMFFNTDRKLMKKICASKDLLNMWKFSHLKNTFYWSVGNANIIAEEIQYIKMFEKILKYGINIAKIDNNKNMYIGFNSQMDVFNELKKSFDEFISQYDIQQESKISKPNYIVINGIVYNINPVNAVYAEAFNIIINK